MTHDLERRLWAGIGAGRFARDVIQEMLDAGDIQSGKQAHATLEKWTRAGLYDYGTALDLGWLKDGAEFPRGAGEVRP